MIELMFAGEMRQFALRPSRYASVQSGLGYEAIGGLPQLFRRGQNLELSNSECRQIIAHALAGPDDPVALMKALDLVDEEMNDRPIAGYIPLVAEIILEAFEGREGADGNPVRQ